MKNRTCRAACAVAAAVVLLLAGGSVARAGICTTCGNSATVGDGIVFDELNVKGKPATNAGPGPWILDNGRVLMGDGTTKAKLRVERHFLTAVAGSTTYSWQELEGMTFSIGMADGRQYKVRLTEVRGCLHTRGTKDTIATPAMKAPPVQPAPKDTKAAKDMKAPPAPPAQPAPKDTKVTKDTKEGQCTAITFWAAPHEEIPQYFFEVQKTQQRTAAAAADAFTKFNLKLKRQGKELVTKMPDDRAPETDFKEHLCRGEFVDKDVLWDKVKASAFAFEGDHYDRAKKTVAKVDRNTGLFNLACYGAAPAKMHLLRHTSAGSDPPGGPPRKTTLPQRTAMLKAITADYCGDGSAWTADGTELNWMDANEWHPRPKIDLSLPTTQANIEAVWGPKGALCLNTPRRLARSSPPPDPNTCTAPAVTRAEVKNACGKTDRKFRSGPGSGAATTPDIPRCDDPAWVSEWPKAKMSGGAVHVVSVNMEKVADYCDKEPPPEFQPAQP